MIKYFCLLLMLCFGFSTAYAQSEHNAKGSHTKTVKKSKKKPKQEITLTGSFESKKGVMTELSCYCYNCGYLTTADGKEIAVCISDEDADVDCRKAITVKGKYVTKSRESGENDPCPAGQMTYFKVSSFHCD